ncbi:MAG: sigma-70 family RNA polymerase sigma factor [Desulfobacteraceae bacterium]|nr:sigma-70 family RNA polymerase sigma factor [Desulfobacteraceae bacterium]
MPADEASTLSPPSTWVDTYGDYLYGFAFYRVQDEELARELVQDTLVAALKARHSFKGKGSEKTWLTGILKHKIIDSLRRKYRDAVFEDQDLDERKMHDSFDHNGRWKTGPAQWASDPERLLEQKAFLDIIRKCLQELPERPAHALSLRELEGESTQTICKVLNVTATNCWVILHRARFLMRKCIETKWLQ